MIGGSRRDARERALGLLYEAAIRDVAPAEVLADLPVAPDAYAAEVVSGVGRRTDDIDALATRFLRPDWPWARVAMMDRLVIRLALFELLERDDVPTGVILAEAVELAKRYGTDESGRFVNGLLASAAAEVRPTSGA